MTGDMYMSEPAPPRRKPAWPWVLLAVGIVLVLVCSVSMVSARLISEERVIQPIRPSSSATEAAPIAPTSTATAAPAAPGQIGEGTYEVGPEVAPGKYKSAGATPSAFQLCTWVVKGSDGKVVDLGTANGENEQQIVTLKAGQTFESSGCKPWVKAA